MIEPRDILSMLEKIRGEFGEAPPDVAVVLGSGLGKFAETIQESRMLSYKDIPGFPLPSIEGHAGELIFGNIGERKVLAFKGRFHFYEGHGIDLTALPARLAGVWGTKNLVVSNAAGGIRDSFTPGAMMLIRDHLNFLGHNPLRGPNWKELGPRFVDMSESYDKSFRALAREIAEDLGISVEEGVYAAFPGPTYETPAEINMLRTLGADAVGMSTVPEVIVARHHDMKVLGLSCITNLAAGVGGDHDVNHEEVIETARQVEKDFARFLKTWIEKSNLD